MTEHSRLARFGLVCVAAVLAAALAAGCGSKARIAGREVLKWAAASSAWCRVRPS